MVLPAPFKTPPIFGLWAVLVGLLILGCAGRLPPPEPMPPAPIPSAPSPAPPPTVPVLPSIRFTIQVGAFSTPERAARYMEVLQATGLDAYYFIDADGLSKVRFERFDTKAAAIARAAALKAQGVIQEYFIVHPRPEGAVTEHGAVDQETLLQEGLVLTARRFVGTAYRWGGSSVRDGFDCSGLTMTVYRLNGLDLPRSSAAQYRAGKPVLQDALRKGDLVFFATNGGSRVSHVGIYAGQGRFIHAPGEGKSIRSAAMTNAYFKKRFLGARRYY